jgi:hypothetical protein
MLKGLLQRFPWIIIVVVIIIILHQLTTLMLKLP